MKELVKVFESITPEFPILGTYFYNQFVLKISNIALTADKVYEECVKECMRVCKSITSEILSLTEGHKGKKPQRL